MTLPKEVSDRFEKKFYCDDCSKYHFVDDRAGSTVKQFLAEELSKARAEERRTAEGVNGLIPGTLEYLKEWEERTRQQQRDEIIRYLEGENVRMKDTHVCRFNDGKQNCDCYLAAVDEIINYLHRKE